MFINCNKYTTLMDVDNKGYYWYVGAGGIGNFCTFPSMLGTKKKKCLIPLELRELSHPHCLFRTKDGKCEIMKWIKHNYRKGAWVGKDTSLKMSIICDVGARMNVLFGRIQSVFAIKIRTWLPKFWMEMAKAFILIIGRVYLNFYFLTVQGFPV